MKPNKRSILANCNAKLFWFALLFLNLNWNTISATPISHNAQLSILTCTPGPDLYSLFGHTAIRFQDSVNGEWVDWVYNYGTFEFDEDFYVKFARGKLDYVLSKQDFGNFQHEYIYTGRGIAEQFLILTDEEKQKLFDLLEENYLPNNRTYRYDFFYDNCSTRVRDIIIRATSGKANDGLGFKYADPKQIETLNRINFSYVYPGEYSFREAIQRYLDYQPWSDFGIDLALGLPCDRTMEKGQCMFLPDSLMNDFNYAIYQGEPLVSREQELLPKDFELNTDNQVTPLQVMLMFFALHILFGWWMIRRKKLFHFTDRLVFFVTGLLGLFVVFLWFFTDHTATKWNLNLLWANPLNFLFAFFSSKKWMGWRLKWMKAYLFILMGILVFWVVLPQRLHFALIPLILALLFTVIRIVKPQFFLGSKSSEV